MLIFGNRYIEMPKFVTVQTIEDIATTTPNDILFLKSFTPPYSLAKHCLENGLQYAVLVNSITEALFANAFNTSFIVCEKTLAASLQKIANEYLWDLKILAIISNDNELEALAKASIDGAVYKTYIKD